MSLRKLSLVLLIAACGGGGKNNNTPDAAPPQPDSGPTPDAPAVLPPGCDYAELTDATNDDLAGMGTAEATNLTFSASTVVCGKLDSTHFQAGQNLGDPGLVDIDSFSVAVGADATVLVTLAGTGAEALTNVQFLVSDADGNPAGGGTLLGTHAVSTATLPAGTYTFSVAAQNAAATTAPIDYKLKIVTDAPDTRCPKNVDTATFTEANDGAANTGNDMVDVRFTQDPAMNRVLTALATDLPEPTNIVTAAGTKYRLSGSSAAVQAADEYTDRDTFLIETGADTDQLSIRLNWTGTTSDHDFMVFEENTITDIASGTLIGNTEPEFVTFAVKPATKYWVWTGTYDTLEDGTTLPTLPAPYDVSLCAESFTP